ncbi:DnaJ protein, putative [Plasmodium malariae]|uniref:DnaJ protein, putative n=1 Tax=Plasmodium malariae TaxID=5858 RepID=A0A1C3L223_PLAMA|nr:DnaJ protein, putative [Plasmodium malariae]
MDEPKNIEKKLQDEGLHMENILKNEITQGNDGNGKNVEIHISSGSTEKNGNSSNSGNISNPLGRIVTNCDKSNKGVDNIANSEKGTSKNNNESDNNSFSGIDNNNVSTEKEEIEEVNEDKLNELFDDFLKDIENVSTTKDNNQDGEKKLNKGDAQKEIRRILANKNSSPFEIFEIFENINMEIIKSKYRRLSVLIHPDKCKIEKASEAFHILNKAYEELKKDDIKDQYKSVYEIAKKNIIKKLNLKKKKNEIGEYLNQKEDEYEISKEVKQLINEECEILLKEQKEKIEYAQKCKLANLRYAQEKEEEKMQEELKKEKERKLWVEGQDERVNSWKNFKKENLKSEKEFQLYKNVSKKKEERTEEEKKKLKKLPISNNEQCNMHKKRRKK